MDRQERQMSDLTHIDEEGRVRMVDVSAKPPTLRTAVAEGRIRMRPETFALIHDQKVKKGNVLETARIAGVMAAKRTADLIPMCHPINITHAEVDFTPESETHSILITASARLKDQTGVEMEALTAVSVAALTIYDMCKAIDRGMELVELCLLEKRGGKSGHWSRS